MATRPVGADCAVWVWLRKASGSLVGLPTCLAFCVVGVVDGQLVLGQSWVC